MDIALMHLSGRRLPIFILAVALLIAGAPTVQAQTAEDLLTQAMERYDAAALPDAISLFDRAIIQLEPNRGDAKAREQLLKAYQYRARARMSVGDTAAAKVDLLAILQLQPSFALPDEVSEALRTLFTETRSTLLGDRLIRVTPATAQVEIDGQPVKDVTRPLALTAGRHTLSARRPGYTSVVDRPFDVDAGTALELAVEMARNSATVTVVTNVVGVEVIVDGASRGVTESAEGVSGASAPKLIADLDVRAHRFEFVRPCYTSVTQTIAIDQFDDRVLPTVILPHAVASVTVETTTPGVKVFIDNVPRGEAPLTLPGVCEGPHVVEMRSPHGRFLRRVELKTGDRERVAGDLAPAFALLSTSGGPEGLRGVGDLRTEVEARLREVRGFTLYAPSLDAAQAQLTRRQLTADWLAYDRTGAAQGAALKMTPTYRSQMSSDLAKAFESQGVASVTVAGTGASQSDVVLALLAAGSTVPDPVAVRLDSADSLRAAIQALDVQFVPFRPGVGILPIDVQGQRGLRVVVADAIDAAKGAGIAVADRIVSVNGSKVEDTQAFNAALGALPASAKVTLEVARGPTTKTVELPLLAQARAMNLNDQSLLFNPLLVHLRHRLAFAANTAAEPVLRLNIAIALMRLGNWEEARQELERTTLPDAPGVGQGTALYYLGICYEKAGRFSDATQAWKKASASTATVTEDGGPIKDLAEAKLAGGSGR